MQQEAFTAAEKAVATIQALVVIGRIQSCDLDLNVTHWMAMSRWSGNNKGEPGVLSVSGHSYEKGKKQCTIHFTTN